MKLTTLFVFGLRVPKIRVETLDKGFEMKYRKTYCRKCGNELEVRISISRTFDRAMGKRNYTVYYQCPKIFWFLGYSCSSHDCFFFPSDGIDGDAVGVQNPNYINTTTGTSKSISGEIKYYPAAFCANKVFYEDKRLLPEV